MKLKLTVQCKKNGYLINSVYGLMTYFVRLPLFLFLTFINAK